MEQKSYLNNMQIVFENNYTIKKRKTQEEIERFEKEKRKNVLQVFENIN
jgi:hypothetical protein